MNTGKTRLDWIDTLAQVLYTRPAFEHIWHCREQNRYPMHPAVRESVLLAPPADWHRLVLEWPHVSINDPARLAYTRSVEHGAANRQTVTSVSKYLSQNFPSLQSHVIRDICAKFGAHAFEITFDMEKMLEWLAQSPRSCMRWDHWRAGEWHPYRVYSPKFGWGLAVRMESNQVMARALVNRESMTFVRSFGAVENDRGHSQNDNALNSWLMSQGYDYADSWDGLRLAKIDSPNGGWSAPYLDGRCQNIDERSDYFLITPNGDYCCNETDGNLENESDISYCEDCESRIRIDDGNHSWVGYYGDRLICDSCCDDNYVSAVGKNGSEYWAHYDDCTCIGDRYYVDDYFADNEIVYVEDCEEHMHQCDCVYLDSRSEWVSSDCGYAVFCEDSDTYEHREDCIIDDDGNYSLISNGSESEAA